MQNQPEPDAKSNSNQSKKFMFSIVFAGLCLMLGLALFALNGSAETEASAVQQGTMVTVQSSSSYAITDPVTILSAMVILSVMTYIAVRSISGRVEI